MIDEFTEKLKLAESLGGDVEYFKSLIDIWKKINQELTQPVAVV